MTYRLLKYIEEYNSNFEQKISLYLIFFYFVIKLKILEILRIMNRFNCYIYFPLNSQWMDCVCAVRLVV